MPLPWPSERKSRAGEHAEIPAVNLDTGVASGVGTGIGTGIANGIGTGTDSTGVTGGDAIPAPAQAALTPRGWRRWAMPFCSMKRVVTSQR